jgi:hypothetical protein
VCDEVLLVVTKDSDLMEYLAYVIYRPENAVGPLRELEPDWEKFPLKWYRYDITLPELRAQFSAFRRGEDLSGYFVARYHAGAEKLIAESDALKHVAILRHRRAAIAEAFRAYDLKLYSACVCIALPIIEGMLWDFATIVHQRHGDVRPAPANASRVSQVLQSKRMSEEIDETFVRYFCDELYPHRNRVLHGRIPHPGCIHEAAKKLATIEYMTRQMEEWVTNEIFHSFRNLPADVYARVFGGFLDGLQADDAAG